MRGYAAHRKEEAHVRCRIKYLAKIENLVQVYHEYVLAAAIVNC